MQQKIQILAAPVGRMLLALIFFMSGISKLSAYEQTVGWMEAMGVPGILLPVVILLEVLGGLCLILGLQARIAAVLLAGFSVISAVIFHSDFNNQIEMIMFMKNISIAGGLLMVVAHGAGALSMDNRNR